MDDQAALLVDQAVGALNNLVLYTLEHPGMFVGGCLDWIKDADYKINCIQDWMREEI